MHANTVQPEAASIGFSVTAKPFKRPLKIDKNTTLMTNGSLMKVESIAECSFWSIMQYFLIGLENQVLDFFFSVSLRQVLQYLI